MWNSAGFRNRSTVKTSFGGKAMNPNHSFGFPMVESFLVNGLPTGRDDFTSRAKFRGYFDESLSQCERFNLFLFIEGGSNEWERKIYRKLNI